MYKTEAESQMLKINFLLLMGERGEGYIGRLGLTYVYTLLYVE